MTSLTIWIKLISIINVAHSETVENSNLGVKYYENLIDEEVEKSKNYQVRTDNSDILGDLENSKDVKYFGCFDFIVVGAGTSGSVVANRLSEIRRWKVLLLEAGSLNDDFADIPYFFETVGKSDRNWGYLTTPQKNGCYGRKNNQCPYHRGKILGGSGTINQLVYARGIQVDFDKWADAGNPSWSWKNVLPHFKKLENFQSPTIDLKYRGTNGLLNVTYLKPETFTQQAIIKANEEIGIQFLEDYNAEKVSGVSILQHNIQNGRRASGANNYVRPAWGRTNLNVTLKAFVTKVLIDENTKTAYGVEFVHDNRKYKALAKKEVLLCGGAANSPQLLMLSGVGPKEDLEKLGIKVLQDSPVGKYMKDHFGFLFLYFGSNYSESAKTTKQLVEEYLKGKGAFTAPAFYRVVNYYNVRNMSSPHPNMEIDFVLPQPVATNYPRFSNLKKEAKDFVDSINLTTHWNFHLYFLHPKSSGTLRLKSASVKDFPLIDSRIFEDSEDLEDMYKGILVALKLIETSIGKKFDMKLRKPPFCSDKKAMSRDYWYCLLRHLGHPAYHLSSTAKMGPSNDSLAVVNDELEVYGIKKLRVIDASIVPMTVTGHMNAIAFLIGEMGADFIKKDHVKIVDEKELV